MKKKMMILLSLLAAAALLASCATASPTAAPTAAPTPAPTASTAPPATAAPTDTPAQTASTPAIREDMPIASSTDVRDANIVSVKDRADGQLDITFDFVDWLSGDAAKKQYLLDNPGATDDDIENAGLNEVGYIRDKSTKTFTYHTGAATQYLLPQADDTAVNAPVALSDFKTRWAASQSGAGEEIKFVKITVDGDTLTKIEFNYLP